MFRQISNKIDPAENTKTTSTLVYTIIFCLYPSANWSAHFLVQSFVIWTRQVVLPTNVTTTNTQEDENPTETVEALLERLNKKREQDKQDKGKRRVQDSYRKTESKDKVKEEEQKNVLEDTNATSRDYNKDEIAVG